MVPEGTVFVTVKGAGVGTVFPGVPCAIGRDIYAFSPEPGVEPAFITSALRFTTSEIVQRAQGDIPGLSKDHILDHALFLPPSREQKRIADALDELLSDLDAGVAALERARGKLRLYRAAVLKAAVEGALTAEWRKQHTPTESASELLKRILPERRRRWEEKQLRKFNERGRDPPKNWKAKYKEPATPATAILPTLPESWCRVTVDQLAQVSSGQTPPGMPSVSAEMGSVVWFRVGDMNAPGNDTYMENGGLRIMPEIAKHLGVKLISEGSIIFPKRGGAIATNKKRRLKFAAACDLNLMAVTPVPAIADYLWLWFLALDLAKLSDGSNVPQINNPDIVPRVVAFPPLAEQEAIVDVVEDQLSVIDHLEADLNAKLRSAQSLRQAILRHAFTGKLVPQDPNDEPASKLLKRISSEREQRARQAAAAKRSNGRQPRQASMARISGKAGRTATKETVNGRIADR
jgi:type I restriction enzyme, S subunit